MTEAARARTKRDGERLYKTIVAMLDKAPPDIALVASERMRDTMTPMQQRVTAKLTDDGWTWDDVAALIGKSRNGAFQRLRGDNPRRE